MSTIHLQNVTLIFSSVSGVNALIGSKGYSGKQTDRAFAERASAQAANEFSSRTGHAGKITALDQVNLTIPDGQTIAIVGPSGCGKSTLLRVVAGLDTTYTGDVFYDDQNMHDIAPKDRFIGMVFQNYALYPHFEGQGNLNFFFRVRRRPDAEAQKRIQTTADIMGIGFDELLKRKPGTLSGGQQQRVAIARAIVRNPRLFLFDEPLSNLDAKLRTQTRIEIKRLLRRFQITSIYVTHDQIEAITLGDQIAVMRSGKIEQMGSYNDLMQNPGNAFVAGFLGRPPMNLLAGGTVADHKLYLDTYTVPLPASLPFQSGQKITLGVRPRAAYLILDDRPPPEGLCLRGTVETVEPDFSRRTQLAYIRTGKFFYAASGSMDNMLNVGDRVETVFPTKQLYFFDEESGLCLKKKQS